MWEGRGRQKRHCSRRKLEKHLEIEVVSSCESAVLSWSQWGRGASSSPSYRKQPGSEQTLLQARCHWRSQERLSWGFPWRKKNTNRTITALFSGPGIFLWNKDWWAVGHAWLPDTHWLASFKLNLTCFVWSMHALSILPQTPAFFYIVPSWA